MQKPDDKCIRCGRRREEHEPGLLLLLKDQLSDFVYGRLRDCLNGLGFTETEPPVVDEVIDLSAKFVSEPESEYRYCRKCEGKHPVSDFPNDGMTCKNCFTTSPLSKFESRKQKTASIKSTPKMKKVPLEHLKTVSVEQQRQASISHVAVALPQEEIKVPITDSSHPEVYKFFSEWFQNIMDAQDTEVSWDENARKYAITLLCTKYRKVCNLSDSLNQDLVWNMLQAGYDQQFDNILGDQMDHSKKQKQFGELLCVIPGFNIRFPVGEVREKLYADFMERGEVVFTELQEPETHIRDSIDQVIVKSGTIKDHGITIQAVHEDIKQLDPSLAENDEDFVFAVILYSSVFIAHDVDSLHTYTGYPKGLIEQVKINCEKNGIWKENQVHCEWFDEDLKMPMGGQVAFWADVLVAAGKVVKYYPSDEVVPEEKIEKQEIKEPVMKNKLVDVRNHLFDTLERLSKDNIDIEKESKRAMAIIQVSRTIIDTGKLECEFLRIKEHLNGDIEGDSFFPEVQKKLE